MKKIVLMGIAILMLFSLASCKNKEEEPVASGAFYSLQEAYDKGFLKKQDLQSIAYYYNDDSMPIYPEALSAELEAAIKEARAESLRTRNTPPIPEATAGDIKILGYYGIYNNCIAVMLSDSYTDYPDVIREIEVAGVAFYYSNGNSITIWKGSSKSLSETLENKAKQAYLDKYLKTENPEATIDDVTFWPFLGIYNDSLVAVFYGGKYHGEFTEYVVDVEIEGLDFSHSNGYPILVWNNGNILGLAEAYGQGLLTKANLEAIHRLYRPSLYQ